jgi:predicted 2-oxoglutarate/Fe(II)-dependent dioxygenase YbiX
MDDAIGGENVGLPLAGEAGLLIAFPSHLVHSVSPVTAGERYTLVTWFFEDPSLSVERD